ncbi:MAG: response regulator [Endomicrobiales bacterium]
MVKILIMDDEPALRNIVYNIVKPLGHPLFTAEDGRQAIEVAQREVPDLALLDMRVPDMDGLEVLAELRKINPNVRAIMLSGFGDVETAVHALKQGAFDYLSKPFKVDEVLKIVNKAIQSIPQGAAHAVAAPAAVAASPAAAVPAASPAPVSPQPKAPAAVPGTEAPAAQSAVKKIPVPAFVIGGLVLALIAGFVAKSFFLSGGSATEFPIPYSNPIGMCWIKPNLWVSDWVVGNIYQHAPDAKLSIGSVYKTSNAQPSGLAFDGEFLWSCNSMEKRIYKHAMDKNITIEAIYATPNANPAGLYFDGANLWVLDTNASKIYKHKMDENLSVVGVYDSPAVSPCGMFRNGEYFFIGDYKTSKIYKVSAKDLSVSEVCTIDEFSEGGYKLASITWDGTNVWASADGVDKILRLPLSALKPVKF